TLKAVCERAGISSDVLYLNIAFTRLIGEKRYDALREIVDSEICFTSTLFPNSDPLRVWQNYLDLAGRRMDDDEGARELRKDLLEIACGFAPQLIDEAIQTIPWDNYDIVGFTTGFNQTVASLALARRIRESFPDKVIMFGGAGCEGEVGPALLDHFEMI